MQPSRKRKRPPTPENESQPRIVKRIRLSGPFLIERPRNPSRSLQRPLIEQVIP